MSALRENRWFWAAVVLLAALALIMILAPYPLSLWLGLADFLVAIGLICVWIEQQERKAQEPPLVVLMKEEDYKKLKERQEESE